MTYNNSCISDEAVAEMQIEAWLSLVERCVRDAEVVGSNPVASTNKNSESAREIKVLGTFFFYLIFFGFFSSRIFMNFSRIYCSYYGLIEDIIDKSLGRISKCTGVYLSVHI